MKFLNLKQQVMTFMNATLKTKAQAQIFVNALKEVKAEDPTREDWTLGEVLLNTSVVVMKWIDACHEECAYRDRMDLAYRTSKKDDAVFEVANILSSLGYRG
jgi:DNA-binding sugar fermentation-stimulating protein